MLDHKSIYIGHSPVPAPLLWFQRCLQNSPVRKKNQNGKKSSSCPVKRTIIPCTVCKRLKDSKGRWKNKNIIKHVAAWYLSCSLLPFSFSPSFLLYFLCASFNIIFFSLSLFLSLSSDSVSPSLFLSLFALCFSSYFFLLCILSFMSLSINSSVLLYFLFFSLFPLSLSIQFNLILGALLAWQINPVFLFCFSFFFCLLSLSLLFFLFLSSQFYY